MSAINTPTLIQLEKSGPLSGTIVEAFQRALAHKDAVVVLDCSRFQKGMKVFGLPGDPVIPDNASDEDLGRLAAQIYMALFINSTEYTPAAARAVIENIETDLLQKLGGQIRDLERPAAYMPASDYLGSVISTGKTAALNKAYPS